MNFTWNHDYPQIARDSGFKLKQIRDGRLDWRLLGTVDIDNLVRTQQLERLDSLVEHISEAPLAKILDSNVLESGVAKYFQIAQLSLQYLLFCKRFLDETLAGIRSTLHDLRAENIELKELKQENNDELLKLHKKLQKIEDINQIVFPCSMCPKNFVSNEMLDTHIRKKHSKHGVGEKPSVENDTNLINTIKLELEIKHLKERLNVAEREIRDKPTHHHKERMDDTVVNIDSDTKVETSHNCFTIATQTDIKVRSVGIQSNLDEPKEQDETDQSEKNAQQEILNEIHRKLLIMEEWKHKEATNNEQSINLIRTKVNEIVSSVDDKLRLIQQTEGEQNENKLTQADIKEMQQMFSENLGKICHESECKLNNAIKSFEMGYKNKLLGLETMIQKYESILKEMTDENLRNSDGRNLSSVRSVKEAPSEINKDPTESQLSESELNPVLTPSKSAVNVISEYSSSETESDEVEVIKQADDKRRSLSFNSPIISQALRPTTAVHRKKDTFLDNSTQKRENSSPQSMRHKALKIFQKRLKFFGINTKTKTLSKHAFDDIAEKLIERRNSYRKKYPNYFATRNRLKQSIEKITKDKMHSMKIEKKLKEIKDEPNVSEHEASPRRNLKIAVDVHSSPVSENSDSSSENEEKPSSAVITNRQSVDHPKKDLDAFKARLERILASPIKKPVVHIRTSTPTNVIVSALPGIDAPSNSSTKKPVPTPRKRVMFDIKESGDSRDADIRKTVSAFMDKIEDIDDMDVNEPPAALGGKSSSETSSISSLLK